jgi:transposase-like protein
MTEKTGKKPRLTGDQKAEFVLLLLGGEPQEQVATNAGVTVQTLQSWRLEFTRGGKSALRTPVTRKSPQQDQLELPGIYPPLLEPLSGKDASVFSGMPILGRPGRLPHPGEG